MHSIANLVGETNATISTQGSHLQILTTQEDSRKIRAMAMTLQTLYSLTASKVAFLSFSVVLLVGVAIRISYSAIDWVKPKSQFHLKGLIYKFLQPMKTTGNLNDEKWLVGNSLL